MNAVNLVKRRAKDPGSARVSRAGDRVLAITDFLGGALPARKIVAARRGGYPEVCYFTLRIMQ